MNPSSSRVLLATVILGLLLSVGTVAGAERRALDEIDVMELIGETQLQSPDQEIMDLVWWMPIEFWMASMISDSTVSEKDRNDLEKTLTPYALIGVASGEFGPFGGVTWKDRSTVESLAVLVDDQGAKYRPLPADQVTADARNLVAMMGPMIASTVGPMGENLHFFFFSGSDEQGKRVDDPIARGSLTLQVGEQTYRWKLPLVALLPPGKCPVDDEPMKGDWKFCPYHGAKVVPAD